MTLSASMLRLFVEALETLRIDWRSLMRDSEIDPVLLLDPEARIRQEVFERVWVAAEELTADPCIGLHAGERIHAHAVNLFGYLMLSSATLGVGIARVVRYQRVLADAPWVEVGEETDTVRLRVGAMHGGVDFRAIHAEYVAALMLQVLGWVSEAVVVPREATFEHDARGALSDYARVLRCRVRFGAERSELVLDAATLARPSVHADDSIAQLHEEFAQRLLSDRDEAETTGRVRRALAAQLESRLASLSSVARQLGMSTRSLQRRLADEGTNFRVLLDELRLELAREHLERRRTPIAGVAHLTGFSDVSAFTRAVERWFGEPPARLRKEADRRRTLGSAGRSGS